MHLKSNYSKVNIFDLLTLFEDLLHELNYHFFQEYAYSINYFFIEIIEKNIRCIDII